MNDVIDGNIFDIKLGNTDYELYGTVNYIDNHYKAYVKRNGVWFKKDNNNITKININGIPKYNIFYFFRLKN